MFDREQKQEKNLEIRERDMKRIKAQEQDAKNREVPYLHIILCQKAKSNNNNYTYTYNNNNNNNNVKLTDILYFPSSSHYTYTHAFFQGQDKKDAKDEKMEALLRKVDADFLAMIKEAEDDESKAAEAVPLDQAIAD
jgi:hypothetical protein